MAHSASPALSQNFLVNDHTVARFVRFAAPSPADHLLEVGAGKGALTAALAPRCGSLVAYEIDPRLIPALRRRLAAHPAVRVHRGDFFAARPPGRAFAVVGNVPYARTSDVVDWCLRAPRLTSASLITQREYARKRTGDYGRWTLLTVRSWPWFGWRLGGSVPRRDFRPVPRVDSAMLRIDRRPHPLLPAAERARYRRLVDLGFTGTGGSLYATLRTAHPPRRLAAAFAEAGVRQDTPVGYVTPGQWLRLHAGLLR
ncbi:ErmE/ErmH/ErmO/ErmR family 23S rRNA (adenine(2058)-N(6))-methyltransferase [Streptomyces boninensis]|uniref:ErmE/ErmH/ErmO/ErmR family 23S rRNA (adenine(2058)-N(6))-methyltransferase n=1 Tax=Streptomyces boninensis TaxID=2039455 RepID=UPI003B2125C5